MSKYKVTFELFNAFIGTKKDTLRKEITVEAGNKRIAAVRAMAELNSDKTTKDLYKNMISIEEVK